MGWFSHRRHNIQVRPEQKWDYIQLDDFKASGPFTYIAYAYVFISLTISIAVYTVDTFTAVNLLIFNTWSSEIQPAISFDVAKWIFSICIILSFVNIAYEHIRAQLIIRRASVAESYLDNLAVRLQSVRLGSGKGWRRFLVFAELTKSKKGAEYIALFTYFSLQSWIRVIFCSGPRQVVNAVTLYSVYNAKLQVNGEGFEDSLESLFEKIKALAQQDVQQALILSGMLFTFVIWVFSALSFIMACLFFVFFLWGWIPREDGGLSGYCERKVTKRLMKIVSKKVDKAIADQERQRKKAELKAAKKAGTLPPEERKATLPTLMAENDDKRSDMPMLARNDTMATLPVYTSRPGTPQGGFELNSMPPMPVRTETTSTVSSSRAPLLGMGADMGQASPGMPSPNYPPSNYPQPNYPARTNTMTSNSSSRRGGGPPQLSRVQTHRSNFSNSSLSQVGTVYSPEEAYPPMPQPVRSPTSSSVASYGFPQRSTPGPMAAYGEDFNNRSESPAPLRQMASQGQLSDYNANGRASPAPTRYGGGSQGGYPGGRPGPPQGSYPNRSQTGPVSYRGPGGPQQQPQRNMTAPGPQRFPTPGPPQGYHAAAGPPPDEYFNRTGTAQNQRGIQQQGPPQPQRQATNQSYGSYNSDAADQQGRWGTPGPRY